MALYDVALRKVLHSITTRTVISMLCIAVLVGVAVGPVLLHPNFCILDCAPFYGMAQAADFLDVDTYIFTEHLSNRARPAFFVLLFPCYWGVSAAWCYLFQSVLLLLVPLLALCHVVTRVTGRSAWGLCAVAAALCTPSFTENYFSLFKGECWTLTGVVIVCWLLLMLLWEPRRLPSYLYLPLAIVGVVAVYLIKETGGAFVAPYFVGVPVLVWGAGISLREAWRRTAFLTIANVVAFAILLGFYLRLDQTYNAGGEAGYATSPEALLDGAVRLAHYFTATAAYLFPVLVVILIVWLMHQKVLRHTEVRKRMSWTAFLLIVIGGMIAALVPWQVLEARAYLVPATLAPVACIVGMSCGLCAAKAAPKRGMALILYVLVASAGLLLASHSVYAVLLGHASEGLVRQRFDAAYDDMFKCVTTRAASNSTVYFMMDHTLPEPQHNAAEAVSIFYDRPDIVCKFPHGASEFTLPGLVAVSDYAVTMNYDRMPVHHEANAQFYNQMAGALPLMAVTQFVYKTPIYIVTNTYHGPQYKSVWGIPAFWDLTRSVYRFGWTIYALTSAPARAQAGLVSSALIANGDFSQGLAAWSPWGAAEQHRDQIRVVRAGTGAGTAYALRIENPTAALLGLKQHVPLGSGAVYRLSATARSVATTSSETLFGGRVAVFLPPQPEQQLVWVSEHNKWWPKELVFTNQVTGTAVVYVHLGYGNVATTGEFTNLRLEVLDRGEMRAAAPPVQAGPSSAPARTISVPQQPQGVLRIGSGQTNSHVSVWDAIRRASDGDTILVPEGVHQEEFAITGQPLLPGGRNIRIVGIGNARIECVIPGQPNATKCGAELSNISGLYISNIVFHVICRGDNMGAVYNALFNNCTSTLIERCVFQSDVYGTNNVLKGIVVLGPRCSVVMRECVIAVMDRTGMNTLHHSATHQSPPTVFQKVVFCGNKVESLEVGDVVLRDCIANAEPRCQQGRREGTLRVGAARPRVDAVMKKLVAGETLSATDIPAW